MDAHTYLYPDYLRRAAELLAEEGPKVCCVGAQPEQVGETPFGEAVALARGSSFGVGNSVYADERVRAEVDTIQAGVYRRAPIEEVGGFRTDMLVGEDEELNWRLKKAGYRLSSTPAFASSTPPAPPGARSSASTATTASRACACSPRTRTSCGSTTSRRQASWPRSAGSRSPAP